MKIALCNYDNGSRWPVLPQNLYHLKACILDHFNNIGGNIECQIIDFNLTKKPYTSVNWGDFDVVGLGFISGYWPHNEAIKFARALDTYPYQGTFIIGGHGPSADPDYYMEKLEAYAAFVGSADISLPKWLENYEDGFVSVGAVQSEGYNLDVNQYYDGPEIDVYKRIKFPCTKENEFSIQLLSGRGCPYNCAFCFRMGEQYKKYHASQIAENVMWWAKHHNITHFQFSDELLMSSPDFVIDVCSRLTNIQYFLTRDLFFDCNGRLNIAAEHPEVLREMKSAGFRYINYGCESMSQEVLNNINKKQTVEQIKKGVYNTLSAGISPGLNFMWGNPGDNEQTLSDAVGFIMNMTDGVELRTIRPVTPYPGTELYNRLIKEGRCSGIDDFYESHVNSDLFSFHFMDIDTMTANEMLGEVNSRFLRRHTYKNYDEAQRDLDLFYHGEIDPSQFRGFREV